MRKNHVSIAAGVLLMLLPAIGSACGSQTPDGLFEAGFEPCQPRGLSTLRTLAHDRLIESGQSEVLIERALWLDQPAEVVAIADGRHFPMDNASAWIRIEVDGVALDSSQATTNWSESAFAVQHGFRVIAHHHLEKGGHRIALVAGSQSGAYTVGAGSGMAVLVAPHGAVASVGLIGASSPIDLMTYQPKLGIDVTEGDPDRPLVSLLFHRLANPGKQAATAVSLLSGSVRHACDRSGEGGYGDALWGIRADGICPSVGNAAWAVNDIDPGAEIGAPVSAHAVHELDEGRSRDVSFVASELAFGSDQVGSDAGPHENDVCYEASDARLISVVGGPVSGMGEVIADAFCSTYTWRCVASTEGVEGCPVANRRKVIGRATVSIPADHDGTVMFSAITRVQGDNDDAFTSIRLWIEIDGERVGTTGVQQLAAGVGAASRTLTATHLAAGRQRLSPGDHDVRVMLRVGSDRVNHLAIPSDQPLVYFD